MLEIAKVARPARVGLLGVGAQSLDKLGKLIHAVKVLDVDECQVHSCCQARVVVVPVRHPQVDRNGAHRHGHAQLSGKVITAEHVNQDHPEMVRFYDLKCSGTPVPPGTPDVIAIGVNLKMHESGREPLVMDARANAVNV